MDQRVENDTFSGGVTSHLNATVGHNGSFAPKGEARSNTDYALGFSSAALELIKSAKESSELRTHLDFLVYPICFNMRHAVELWLKKWWKDLSILAKKKEVKLKKHRDDKIRKDNSLKGKLMPFPVVDEASTHDLSNLWSLISEYAPVIDSRFRKVIPLLEPYIQDIADIDPTGQTFRYPASNTSRVHLSETPLINIRILELRFTTLFRIFDFLDTINNKIKYEYSWVETPNQTSYYDLQSISLILGKYDDKDEETIPAQAKKIVMDTFGISSNEYGRTIYAIEKDHYLNNTLNIINKPRYLDEASIDTIFKVYFDYQPIEEYLKSYQRTGITIYKPDFDKLAEELKKRAELTEILFSSLSREQISESTAILECYSQSRYMGIYEQFMKENVAELSYMSETELRSYIAENFFGSMLIEKLSSILLQRNCINLIQPKIEEYGLTEAPWYKNFKEQAFNRCYAEYFDFESSIEKFQEEVAETLVQVRHERLSI